MELVQPTRRRWLLATLALAAVLAPVERTFTNYTSKLSRYPARAAASDSDVIEEQWNYEGDDDVDLDEEVEPYSDWEEAEREVSSLLERTAGLENKLDRYSAKAAASDSDFIERQRSYEGDADMDLDEEVEAYSDSEEEEWEVSSSQRQITGLENMVGSNQTVKKELDRAGTVRAIHLKLGQGQQRLSSKCMRQFAEMTGFEGNKYEWADEFSILCREINCSPRYGLTSEDLLQVVSDQSDSGTYYSDEELESICNELGAEPQFYDEHMPRHEERDVWKENRASRNWNKPGYRSPNKYKPKKKQGLRSRRLDPWA
eukprot:TRINITY_DN17985_c0_g1_i2.p1 TRINITY_DN17985_c0_g1~~TRINITY_DN17985_c0_g1_i2.p1  ORF type:complete len:315 (+),score=56.34 TRINITY_DN17985_c0_g1_i2:94-1038(+)